MSASALAAIWVALALSPDDATTVTIFDTVALEYDASLPDPSQRDGYVLRHEGQVAERTLDLPPAPEDQRDARRITLKVVVEPRLVAVEPGRYRPGDPWTRMGNVTLVLDGENEEPQELELMRFITGFGGPAVFTQDVTAFAPLLSGRQTLRTYLSTYLKPGWDVSVSLIWHDEKPGFRRPIIAHHLFNEQHVTATSNVLRTTVEIPKGLDLPRLRILSTGHATDGAGGDEFITRTHILRIDGEEIARWRPWAERGESLRHLNPASARHQIDGRWLWSSDLDRSGWQPGRVVWPLMIPTPELVPGTHEIEIEIEGIRPAAPDDEDGHHGYWRLSATVLADEPWPLGTLEDLP
jgi:hypothetical protein